MEQYKTDAEIYAVLEREIIDLTIRPGSSLSENPLCARFGAPRTLIRVVLQKLQENGLFEASHAPDGCAEGQGLSPIRKAAFSPGHL